MRFHLGGKRLMGYLRYPNLKPDDAAQMDGHYGSAVRRTRACFDCRIALKGPGAYSNRQATIHCPLCGKQMTWCSNWRFPKKSDVKGWKAAEKVWSRVLSHREKDLTSRDTAEMFGNRWRKQDA